MTASISSVAIEYKSKNKQPREGKKSQHYRQTDGYNELIIHTKSGEVTFLYQLRNKQ